MKTTIFVGTVSLAACSALSQTPGMGGDMEHIMVHLHGNAIEAHVHAHHPLVMHNPGQTYPGAASVLNGLNYNAQYGWMLDGFWGPPAGSVLWIEQTDATDGLLVYRGGTMTDPGDFAPIFGTDGSIARIRWDGSMLHNWYAAAAPGDYTAAYSIYFGDAQGNPTDGYAAGSATLSWTVVPAPAAGLTLLGAGLLCAPRRRGGAL